MGEALEHPCKIMKPLHCKYTAAAFKDISTCIFDESFNRANNSSHRTVSIVFFHKVFCSRQQVK